MKYLYTIGLFFVFVACNDVEKEIPFTAVAIETIYEDSISIRAIDFLDNSTLAFAANKGVYGRINLKTGDVKTSVEKYHATLPEYRAIAHNNEDFFMLSVGNPALLYKTGELGRMELVYMEEGDGVFYDAMAFWNPKEGIAIGDTVDGCFSIIVTRDSGHTWHKLPCEVLPEAIENEGAFAASNTNISIVGDKTWIATTKRILFSPDKGKTWKAMDTPILNEEGAQGIYSINFWDSSTGVAIGGDYTNPNANISNKAITRDGGMTWSLLADGKDPQYKSCIQFVPNGVGNEIVTLGFTGIAYSYDTGTSWKELSKESFYTLRFLNDSVAYAAGKGRIAKLTFR